MSDDRKFPKGMESRIEQKSRNEDRRLQRGELRFDIGESGFKGLAAERIRGALVQNALALQLERHPLAAAIGLRSVGFRVANAVRLALLRLLDLFFHGLAFPTSGHTLMVMRCGWRRCISKVLLKQR